MLKKLHKHTITVTVLPLIISILEKNYNIITKQREILLYQRNNITLYLKEDAPLRHPSYSPSRTDDAWGASTTRIFDLHNQHQDEVKLKYINILANLEIGPTPCAKTVGKCPQP